MKRDLVFISWAPFCSRSDSIAKKLGGTSYMIYAPKWGSRYSTILFKYLSQTVSTLKILFRDKPKVVFVMSPPVIACLAVWIYAILLNKSFVIDAHTGTFLDKRWKPLLFLARFFCHRAVTTLVTNAYLEQIVRSWAAECKIVPDVPVIFPEPHALDLKAGFNIALICTFTWDEPLSLFLEAAREIKGVHFYVTGNHQELPKELLDKKPDNVEFTGFLPDSEYVGLLMSSDAVMCLTTLDHTMQRGAYEGMYLGKPVIVSDYKVLRDNFYKGTVFVENTVGGLKSGIYNMRDNLVTYQEQIEELRKERLERWRKIECELLELIPS